MDTGEVTVSYTAYDSDGNAPGPALAGQLEWEGVKLGEDRGVAIP